MENRKQIAIEKYISEPFQIGENVYVKRKHLSSYSKDDFEIYCTIKSIEGNIVGVVETAYERQNDIIKLDHSLLKKNTYKVGYNPIIPRDYRLDSISYSLESIIHEAGFDKRLRYVQKSETIDKIEVPELNWNPYVIQADGSKFYYQRDFCWSLEEKQNLIESIYNNISLGRIIIRRRSYEWIQNQLNKGNSEVAFKDIVDGKQRLNTIIEFVSDKFPDKNGYYFSEFSKSSENDFLDHQLLGFACLDEKATDKNVIDCFLRTNFAGVPMSIDHINYVKSIKL